MLHDTFHTIFGGYFRKAYSQGSEESVKAVKDANYGALNWTTSDFEAEHVRENLCIKF